MNNSERPAYPLGTSALREAKRYQGLTKREYFAAMAMQGLLCGISGDRDSEFIVEDSLRMADELLKQIES